MKDTEAAQWLMRLQGEDVPQAEVAAWLEWTQADPDNIEAFERVRRLHESLLMAGEAARDQFQRLADAAPAGRSRKGPVARAWWIAAVMAAAVVAAVAWLLSAFLLPVERMDYRTQRGGQLDIRLEDQSRVVLDADSALSSRYSFTHRLLKLERGEAWFEVEADDRRPFIVDVGSAVVTATGTAFNVRRLGGRTVVSVTEGDVQVARPGTEAPQRLRKGEEALVPESPGLGVVVREIDPASVMERQHGYLRITGEPLGNLLEDINRHAPVSIITLDDEVRAMEFWGVVILDSLQSREEVEAWVQFMAGAFQLRASHREDGTIVLEGIPPVTR